MSSVKILNKNSVYERMHLHGEGISVMMLIPQWPVRLIYNHVDCSW